MDTYRVPVGPLVDDLGASTDVCDEFAVDVLEVGAESFSVNGPATFNVTLTNTGTGIVMLGQVDLPVTATCSRCLCDFPTIIQGDVEALYVAPGKEEGVPEEQDFEYVDAEESVDIIPALMAALVLEAPFAPLHDEACAGICPDCGADLNDGPCGCDETSDVDHPFAALKSLLAQDSSDTTAP